MVRDVWAAGDAYEAYVGRWSRLVAKQFLGWLGAPAERRWLDVGCGTGALTATVLAMAGPVEVVGVDPSDGFLATARALITDARAAFQAGDAQALPLPDDQFDVVVSALALNFVPDPRQALAEFVRVATPGALVGAYVWDYAGGMAMLRHFWDAARQLDPAATELDEGSRFPLCDPGALRALWLDAGLTGVVVDAIDGPAVFTSFDDYWTPFLGGQGPAPSYLNSLSPHRRDALRDLLRVRLPEGVIRLTARAWAVKGTV